MDTLTSGQPDRTLIEFQHAFAQALRHPDATPATHDIAVLTAQPGFAVYRNTVMKGSVDALQANYPAVARLVGDQWFRAAAAVYVGESPPTDASLLHYGASFADFLARFEPAAELPYLPGVARLDRLWTESHTARDEDSLPATALSQLTPAALAAAVLYPHAAARWAWFANAPIYSIWARNRHGATDVQSEWQPEWKPEGALLTRRHGTVIWIKLDAAGFAFLEQCARGGTLAQVSTAALTAHPDTDLAKLMAALLQAGTFNRLSITRTRKS